MSEILKRKTSVGAKFRASRMAMGLSQKTVAARLQMKGFNINEKTISRLERGMSNPQIIILLELAEIYNTPIQDFFEIE